MRSSRVSRPFRNTQALNGLMVGPAVRSTPNTSVPTTASLPMTAPPTQRPWPSKYLVAEWITISAPSSSGRCRAGVQKQLSTTSRQSLTWASSARALISATSVTGFEGVSRNSQIGKRYKRRIHTELGQIVVKQHHGSAKHGT